MLIEFSHFLLLVATNMDSNSTSNLPKSKLSSDDQILVCGVAVLIILFIMFSFFYAIWKIYSDEETYEETNVRIRVMRRKRQSLRTTRWIKNLGSKSEVQVPNNTPIGSSDGYDFPYIIVFSHRK